MENDGVIEQLAADKRVAEELLYLVMDSIGEPVVLSIEESRTKIIGDKALDIQLNPEAGTMTLTVVGK